MSNLNRSILSTYYYVQKSLFHICDILLHIIYYKIVDRVRLKNY